tara:strand:+ start:120 stop:266 length:147 start_codon:yes stop_codon:yes gene_type:complete
MKSRFPWPTKTRRIKQQLPNGTMKKIRRKSSLDLTKEQKGTGSGHGIM